MPDSRLRRALRFAKRSVAVVVIVAAVAAAVFLPFAGRYLSVNEPLERADAIFVLAGPRVERWLEAVDLHRERWAPLIVLSPGYSEAAENRLREMGIRYPSEVELARDAMIQLKVPAEAIRALPHEVDNTAQEAASIRALFDREGWRTLIVVTSVYHSRRVQLAFGREFRDTGGKVIVRTTRYDDATPRRWWTTRNDIRYVASELQKLLLYRLGLRG
jgi:uncharacterized SAM-binding protein YcdF (DUF218 family)